MNVGIPFELYNREYDNCMLLKAELERRGYKVNIYSRFEELANRKNDILIVPNSYHDEDVDGYRYKYNCSNNKIICMHYEQVLSEKIRNSRYHIPKGKARDLFHICWGKNTVEYFSNDGISKDKLFLTGAIQLDFLDRKFDSFYYSKEDISVKFSLDQKQKWLFFISSFSYVDNDLIIKSLTDAFDNDFINDFKVLSTKSQKIILQWFDQLLTEHENYIVIYRPHPVEKNSVSVKKMMEKYPDRFRCISDLSVKQWLKVADVPCAWISTSIAEAYAAKRNCIILRPVQIPQAEDVEICKDAFFVKDYEQLKKSVLIYDPSYSPISRVLFERFYTSDDSKLAFLKICDLVDRIKLLPAKEEPFFYIKRWEYLIKEQYIIRYPLKDFYKFLFKRFHFTINNKIIRNRFALNVWENNAVSEMNRVEDEKNKYKILCDIVREVQNV